MFIIIFIVGILIGSLGIYLCLKNKLHTVNELDKQTLAQNDSLKKQNEELNKQFEKLTESTKLAASNFKQMSEQIQQAADTIYEQSYTIANEKMSNSAEEMAKKYQAEEEKLRQEYLELAENQTKEYQAKILDIQKKALFAESQLTELQSKFQSALEAAKRQEELELNMDKYRILLSNDEKNEIQAFNSIAHLILNKRNLYMFLWTNYYSKRVNELAIRVLGDKPIIGIYKITNIETQQIYIGQSKQIRERWREHCKAGLQIDTPGNNKLYTNMIQYGLGNFTFELMEQCSIDKLDERERYWIEFYKSCDYGLNGNKGIKR